MKEDIITIRLSKWDINRINRAVRKGFYTNRSDFVRSAVRKLADELEDVPNVISEMIEEASRKGITHDDVIKVSKAAGKEAHRRKKRS